VQYEGKYKHASMAQQIAASNITNKSRLRILNARQQVLDSIFESARQKLPEIQKDKEAYGKLLKKLILEVRIGAPLHANVRGSMH
jgi:V-type H+-transporting ATPase subunit E